MIDISILEGNSNIHYHLDLFGHHASDPGFFFFFLDFSDFLEISNKSEIVAE